MNPILSLIIPVYKVEAYVGACLDSILTALEQVKADESFEVICVDDGSPDSCGEILESYRARFAALPRADRVRYTVIHQANAGVSVARNVGLDVATGGWVWFIDSDDAIAPFALDYLSHALREHPADVFKFREQNVTSLDAPIPFAEAGPVVVYDLTREADVRLARKHGQLFCFLRHACYRRSAIGHVRFREGLLTGEDQLFCLQVIARSSTLVWVNVILYNYLQRPGSCMATMNGPQTRSLLERMPLLMEVLRSWTYGDIMRLPLLRHGRAEMSTTLMRILRFPPAERHELMPLYYETGKMLYADCPFHRLLLRTHCPPLILLVLHSELKLRIAVLKIGFVRWLKVCLRGY